MARYLIVSIVGFNTKSKQKSKSTSIQVSDGISLVTLSLEALACVMAIQIGVNMEFIRPESKSFAAGVERAAQLGFRYVEP